VVVLAPQDQGAALHDPPEIAVARHLEADLAVLGDAVQPGPERYATRRRATGRHTLREVPAAREGDPVAPLASRRERRVHRHAAEDERARAQAGVGEQLAAVERLVERARGHRPPEGTGAPEPPAPVALPGWKGSEQPRLLGRRRAPAPLRELLLRLGSPLGGLA
jgi:hypothetical protein